MPSDIPSGGTFAVDTQDSEFKILSAPSLVRFLSRGVQPPSIIYLKHTDTLQVGCASSQVGESVTFNYRLLRADGSLIKGQFVIQVPSTRAIVTQQEPMAEGFLLSVSCKAAVAFRRGQTFARVFLTSGSLGPGQPSYMLMADYVTGAMAPAHPNGRVLAPTEGPGNPVGFVVAAPGAGANWSTPVPNNTRWRLMSFRAQLTTSAVVANRLVSTLLTTNAFETFRAPSGNVQPASIIAVYSASQMTPLISPGTTRFMLPVPPNPIQVSGDTIGVETLNIDAADQWGGIQIGVEEWLDNV